MRYTGSPNKCMFFWSVLILLLLIIGLLLHPRLFIVASHCIADRKGEGRVVPGGPSISLFKINAVRFFPGASSGSPSRSQESTLWAQLISAQGCSLDERLQLSLHIADTSYLFFFFFFSFAHLNSFSDLIFAVGTDRAPIRRTELMKSVSPSLLFIFLAFPCSIYPRRSGGRSVWIRSVWLRFFHG